MRGGETAGDDGWGQANFAFFCFRVRLGLRVREKKNGTDIGGISYCNWAERFRKANQNEREEYELRWIDFNLT